MQANCAPTCSNCSCLIRARYFIDYENCAGGQGARAHADGMDGVQLSMTNTSNLPVEAMELEFPLRSARQKIPAQGLAGGLPGGLGAFIVNPGPPNERRLPSTSSETPLANGDLLRVVTPGGGGYGNSRERDRARVERDVAEGILSKKAARDAYGFDN